MGVSSLKSPWFDQRVAGGLLWAWLQAWSGVSQRQPGVSQGGAGSDRRVWPPSDTLSLFFSCGSTDVFICTSPIKKYRYCPYEKVSRIKSQFLTPAPCCLAKAV